MTKNSWPWTVCRHHRTPGIAGLMLLVTVSVMFYYLLDINVQEYIFIGNHPRSFSLRNKLLLPKPKIQERVLATSANLSSYHLINRQKTYRVNDRIRVRIQARDITGKPQKVGGAYFRATLESADIKAASRSDGEIIDFDNGTYLAEFVLRWSGKVSVRVMLVDGVLAVRTLRRIREDFPDRGSYIGHFKQGSVRENVTCNVDHVAPQARECDFTDEDTRIPWFCEKPTNPKLGCKHWYRHNSNNTHIFEQQLNYIRPGEEQYFETFKKYLPCNSCSLKVIDAVSKKSTPSWLERWLTLPPCSPAVEQTSIDTTSGYYYKNTWYATRCHNQHFDRSEAIAECLRNKTLLFLGDSTIKQIHSYLTNILNASVLFPLECMAHSRIDALDFTMYQKFHGLPSRGTHGGPAHCLRTSIPNVLDGLDWAPDVFVLTIGPHFSIHSVELFRERLRLIRRAVERLHKRNPDTLFILKSANTREYEALSHILSNNEWYMYKLDRLFREAFADYPNMVLIDAWDMTVSQFYPDDIHPKKETLAQITSWLLSYICPSKQTLQ